MSESDTLCLICLEYESYEGKKCYKMTSILNYIKQCGCDCIVHSSCLHKWHTFENNKCIICKKIVFIKNSNYNEIISPELDELQKDMIVFIKFIIFLFLCYASVYIPYNPK
jgi:hypothetical protein